MERVALILARDTTGLGKLGRNLVERFGYALKGNAEACSTLDEAEVACEAIDLSMAERLLKAERTPQLVIANYLDATSVGSGFMSWKAAWKAFDREIVSCIRLAANRPTEVAVFGDPGRYDALLSDLAASEGDFSIERKIELASIALAAAAEFDATLSSFLETQAVNVPDLEALAGYPKTFRKALPRAWALEEGANRFQKAGLYGSFFENFEQVGGPNLDFESILNVSWGAYLIGEFEKPAAAVIRRGNIVAACCDSDASRLWAKLYQDAEASEFPGSVLVTNHSIDDASMSSIDRRHGLILAPRFSMESVNVLGDEIRLLHAKDGLGYESLHEYFDVVGGFLIQDRDRAMVNPFPWQAEGPVHPLVDQWDDLLLAAKLCRHAKSAALVAVHSERLVAIAAGQSSQAKAMRMLGLDDQPLANCVVAMDETIADADFIMETKRLGVAGIVHPGLPEGSAGEGIREAIIECGLLVMATGRSQRKL